MIRLYMTEEGPKQPQTDLPRKENGTHEREDSGWEEWEERIQDMSDEERERILRENDPNIDE